MSNVLSPVCILAGGLGTRLRAVDAGRPKSLVAVAGRPFIEHQLELLAAHGAGRVVLCVGYLGELIEREIGDGACFGLDIRYAYDGAVPIGTAAAIRRALPLLGSHFLVLYGDTYLRIDYRDVDRAFAESGQPALMTVLHNADQLQPSNACFDGVFVTAYSKDPRPPGAEWLDYGLSAFEAALFEGGDESDLVDMHESLATAGSLVGYEARHRFFDIGTSKALRETDSFLRSITDQSLR